MWREIEREKAWHTSLPGGPPENKSWSVIPLRREREQAREGRIPRDSEKERDGDRERTRAHEKEKNISREGEECLAALLLAGEELLERHSPNRSGVGFEFGVMSLRCR